VTPPSWRASGPEATPDSIDDLEGDAKVAFRDWAELTWEDVRDLDRARAVGILPVGAVEAHGPHLPLATDVVIAQAMARAGAERLEAAGWSAVLMPALPYSAAPFAAAFPGTVSIAPETLTAMVLEIAAELGRHGFAALAIANAHLDPAHLAALSAAVARAGERGLPPVVAPDLTRKPWGSRLSDEFKSGACHAGRFESSIVMAERPASVREPVRAGLPANPQSLSSAIREGRGTFAEAGGPRAYFGAPAEATADEGRTSVATLGTILSDAVLAVLAPRGVA
jgi:creatinine amidohydrolase